MRKLTIALTLLLTAATLEAQPTTPSEFIGFESGTTFARHHQLVDYLEELADSSDRVLLEEYGETWEGRPLTLLTISTAENLRQIDRLRELHSRAIDPVASGPIPSEAPVVVWLAFGIHGNESSSAEAAMRTAWWLAAEAPEELLEKTVVLIDPLQNPDGRDRYVNWFRQKQGLQRDALPYSAAHDEPWPGGRYNHYLFDMNRDWSWATQPETRARIKVYREWNPQVVVDLHEMFWESSYFFPPATDPINDNIHPRIEELLETFGRANGERFSESGWAFYVGEHFDLFYPGYGDSWPSLRGSVGMTYEVGGHGGAGVLVETEDGREVTLSSRIERHTAAALTTVRTAAANREELLRFTRDSRARFLDDPTTYMILPGSRWFDEAVELLVLQGIDVTFLTRAIELRAEEIASGRTFSRSFPKGTAVVRTAQPLGQLVRTLFEREPRLSEDFVRRQRDRIDNDEPTEFYDITGWSIPLAFDLEGWAIRAPLPRTVLGSAPDRTSPALSPARYAWAVPGDDSAVYSTAGALLAANIRFGVTSESLDAGTLLPAGSLIILRGRNDDQIDQRLAEIASRTGSEFISFDQGWSGGRPLGSTTVHDVRDPRILIAGGEPVSPTSFGSIWHAFDAELGIPHTVVQPDRLARIDLDEHNVIILPSGWGWSSVLNGRLIDELGEWVRSGGTLIAIGNAAAAFRRGDEPLSGLEQRPPAGATENEEEEPSRYTTISVPGAIVSTSLSPRAPYTFGYDEGPPVLISGSVALEPLSRSAANIVTIDDDDPVIAGIVWPESQEQVTGAAWMVAERIGRGRVVTFASEPHFRGFWKGTLPLLLNTALYSPSFL